MSENIENNPYDFVKKTKIYLKVSFIKCFNDIQQLIKLLTFFFLLKMFIHLLPKLTVHIILYPSCCKVI